MNTVIFSHTKKQEKEYRIRLLDEKEWFKQEQFSVFLPQDMDDIEKESSRKDGLLTRKIIQLEKTWRAIETDYFQIVQKFHFSKPKAEYACHISRFGPEGKYCRPNQIFVRLRTKRDEIRAVETIGHELLHLLFADLFNAKKLNYAEREGIIDALILETDLIKLLPKYKKQSIGKVNRVLFKSITHT